MLSAHGSTDTLKCSNSLIKLNDFLLYPYVIEEDEATPDFDSSLLGLLLSAIEFSSQSLFPCYNLLFLNDFILYVLEGERLF